MLEIILGVILLVLAVALVALVLMQSDKDSKLSGTIAGGADTFFGKSKAASKNKGLTLVTTIVSIVFVALVLAMYLVL